MRLDVVSYAQLLIRSPMLSPCAGRPAILLHLPLIHPVPRPTWLRFALKAKAPGTYISIRGRYLARLSVPLTAAILCGCGCRGGSGAMSYCSGWLEDQALTVSHRVELGIELAAAAAAAAAGTPELRLQLTD